MLEEKVRTLCRGVNPAALTTLFGDGSPQTQMMWVDCDDDHVLMNTEPHRQKYKNLARDPRVTVMVWEADNPYSYAEIRGRVVETVGGEESWSHINYLSNKYLGIPYPLEVASERVILKIAPDRQLLIDVG